MAAAELHGAVRAASAEAEAARESLRDTFEKTRGCAVEVIMKDLHTCRGEPHRMWEWTRMASALAEEFAC